MLDFIVDSKSRTFLTFCFCFIGGVAIASLFELKVDFLYLYLSLFILATFLIVFWKNKITRFSVICILFVVFGVIRYLFAFPLSPNRIANYIGKETELTGFVSREPDVREDGVRYVVDARDLTQPSPTRRGDTIKIYFKFNLYPRFQYGDVLKLNCELEKPEANEDFRYDMYMAKEGIFALCQSPWAEKIGEGEGFFAYSAILWVKNKAADKINLLWHEPIASFMAGLLYGYRGGLGELNQAFNRTGITHIVAISGYNISIIATILITSFTFLYIPRKKAFWLVCGGILLFVIFAGASASVVRAGIMGVLVLLAKQLGRLSRVGNVLALSAVLMLLQNPLVLRWDAGFQLSFAATFGLVYLSPKIQRWFIRLPEFYGLREVFVSTMAAIIATLPLIMFNFGRLSIVAPIVNVSVLWLIPFLMLSGFLAVILSFIFLPAGQVVAWIAWVGLKYIVLVVTWFSGFKWAAIEFRINWVIMILLYLLIVSVFYVQNQDRKLKNWL
ncbi:MAG: ComEC family competence protein [Candidatus Magasanikbacteria bacterium]|nr:ComEC family competence protein [Candidatus Magasanikbacteria bacterium]